MTDPTTNIYFQFISRPPDQSPVRLVWIKAAEASTGDRVRPAGGWEGGDMEPAGEGDYVPWPDDYPDEVNPQPSSALLKSFRLQIGSAETCKTIFSIICLVSDRLVEGEVLPGADGGAEQVQCLELCGVAQHDQRDAQHRVQPGQQSGSYTVHQLVSLYCNVILTTCQTLSKIL